jgi:hypothetical protein
MKAKFFLVAIGAVVAFSSCRKHTCECSTDVYDSQGYYQTTVTEVHTVKSMTTLRAISKCDEYDTSSDTYCSIY